MKNKFFKKKPKEPTREEKLQERFMAERERCMDALEKEEPGTDKYAKVQQAVHQNESVVNEKKRIEVSDENSKREHIGKTKINVAGSLIGVGIVAVAESKYPFLSNIAKSMSSSFGKGIKK